MEHKGINVQYLGMLHKGNCNHVDRNEAEWKVSASINRFKLHTSDMAVRVRCKGCYPV